MSNQKDPGQKITEEREKNKPKNQETQQERRPDRKIQRPNTK